MLGGSELDVSEVVGSVADDGGSGSSVEISVS